MIEQIGEIVGGHRIDEALALSKKPPCHKTARDGAGAKGDIGRLMPLVDRKDTSAVQGWQRYFLSMDIPFIVVRDAEGRLSLYKERKARVGPADLDLKN